MPFRIALSGSTRPSPTSTSPPTTSPTSTTGFKGSRAEFADLFAVSLQGVAANASGNGVRVAAVAQQFAQGNIEFTDNTWIWRSAARASSRLSDGGALPTPAPAPSRSIATATWSTRSAAPAGLSAARGWRLQHRRLADLRC